MHKVTLEVSPTGYHLHCLQLSPSSPIRVGIHHLCIHVLDLLPVRPLAPCLSQLPFQLSHSSLQTSDFLFCSGHAFAIFQYNRGQVRIIRIGCRPYYWAPPSIFCIAQNLAACKEVISKWSTCERGFKVKTQIIHQSKQQQFSRQSTPGKQTLLHDGAYSGGFAGSVALDRSRRGAERGQAGAASCEWRGANVWSGQRGSLSGAWTQRLATQSSWTHNASRGWRRTQWLSSSDQH